MVHAQKVVLEILWQITMPRSKNIFKKWVLCDKNQEIIAAVPQAGTRPPGQPENLYLSRPGIEISTYRYQARASSWQIFSL